MTQHLKLGICAWCVPCETAPETFRWIAEAGLEGMVIDLPSPENRAALIDLSNDWNISLTTLGLNELCQTAMTDPGNEAAVESIFQRAIEAAVTMHIPLLQVPSFCASMIEDADGLKQTIRSLRTACRLAEGTGLKIGTENALPAAEQFQLLEEVGSDSLKIYFDTRNAFSMRGYDSADILRQLLPHICEVHLKDGMDNGPWAPLGQGNSGLFQCLEILKQNEYTGWMHLENDYRSAAPCADDISAVRTYFE